jgi:hypothetical protein
MKVSGGAVGGIGIGCTKCIAITDYADEFANAIDKARIASDFIATRLDEMEDL